MILKEYRREIIEKFKESQRRIKEKMVLIKCDKCGDEHFRTLKHYKKMIKEELFDRDYCNKCWRPILNNRPEKISKMREALKKVWSSQNKRDMLSQTMKKKSRETGYPVGDKNPMKKLETRRKVGETRSKMMTPKERKRYSDSTKKAWFEGKFIGVNNVWKCLWYDYEHSDGKIYKVQGTWELKFIKWLDNNNLKFRCHKDKIKYIDDDNKERWYYPDFFIYAWGKYVDIKSDYVYSKQKNKFKILFENNKNIIILFKKDLEILNIKL
jgi:hypothetical protein